MLFTFSCWTEPLPWLLRSHLLRLHWANMKVMLHSSATFWAQYNVTSVQNCSWSTLVMRCGWQGHSLLGANRLQHHFWLFIISNTTFNSNKNNTPLGTQPEFMAADNLRPVPMHHYCQALHLFILLSSRINISMAILVHLHLMCSQCRLSIHQPTQANCLLSWTLTILV